MASRMRPFQRIMEPADRIAEVMFGLIMALTFTGSISISDAGRNDVRAMLIGALACGACTLAGWRHCIHFGR